MDRLNHQYIKRKRIEHKLSLQYLANSLGFKNASTYLKYESGLYAFKAEHLPMLATVLKCDISDFFNQNVAKIATRL